MEINSSIDTIIDMITDPDLRKKWDAFISHYSVVEKVNENQSLITIVYVSDRNEVMDLALLRTIKYEPGHASITYNSIETPKIPKHPEYSRVHCQESRYDIYSIGFAKTRATTDSTDESNSSDYKVKLESESISQKSKIVYSNQFSNELTRFLLSELIEETNFIKNAWKNLKKFAENEHDSTPVLVRRIKENMIMKALSKKTIMKRSESDEINTN